ncbi:MAG: isoaspartyl peptidase/L-asparaginase [Candidatus Binataceae bacterium]|nr:isoaspartyl peptidase/L-asparaginase [Candidatus Binataceae bacterium]
MNSQFIPALVLHGGAGARGPASERPRRRQGMMFALRCGMEILRGGGRALDAVSASIRALEDDEYFNAGYGSVLTADGRVEMDAALMLAEAEGEADLIADAAACAPMRAGAVAVITRVKNPILLARAVMEDTPHLLMAGAGAERIARRAGIPLCRPEELISPRAKARWRIVVENRLAEERSDSSGGTVGAVAIDTSGIIATGTSTGGMTGKMPGRIGDTAIVGAGIYASGRGAASATGHGEAIIRMMLCRQAVMALGGADPNRVAADVIADLGRTTGSEAGIILVDHRGRVGFAHNAGAMEVASFDPERGQRHHWPAAIK